MAKTKGKSRKAKVAPKVVKPAKAIKPAKPSKPSLPLPPPPAPPPVRDELPAPRDIGRLIRYGETFGANKIDVRFLPNVQLPVTSGRLALVDPGTPKSWRVLDRPIANGQFRVMLSIARTADNQERLAAVTIHTGRPPIAKWTVAHFAGTGSSSRPKSPDQLPSVAVTNGWLALLDAAGGSPGIVAMPGGTTTVDVPLTDGRRALALPCGNGEYVAYWAVDAADKPICLVVDFDVFTQKDWKAKPSA